MLSSIRKCASWIAVAGMLAGTGCGGGSSVPTIQSPAARSHGGTSSSPIQHVILVVQENRTFNNFFATYPGADGTTTGLAKKNAQCNIPKDESIPLQKGNLIISQDLNHGYEGYHTARDGGKMDGFDDIPFPNHIPECLLPYQYVDPTQIQAYWTMAQQYALAEHMFTVQGSSSFTGHQDLIAGGTIVEPGEAMVNLPTCSGACHWGCDAPPGTVTALINAKDQIRLGKGPFPCTNDFKVNYPTLRDLLDAKGISWKYYVPPPCCNVNGRLFTAYDVIYSVRYGPEWKTNISSPQTNIFKDISKGTLPAMSWVIPDGADSDHPGEKLDNGPAWVASIVNAIGPTAYWNNTAIIVVWDDWGGLYDGLNPKRVGYGGLGPRVPALIVSAYAKPGYISATDYDFGSILKYIEQNWSLGSLGGSDKNANSIIDCFNYSQPPNKFKIIPAQHSETYFIHRKPPGLPPDDDM